MTFSYDQEVDALAITLRDDKLVARTFEIDPGTLVDVDEHGSAVVIEVLRPSRAWPIDEVLERFDIPAADAEVLRAMWAESAPYPFVAELAGV